MTTNVTIVAEAGVNHNGDLGMAEALVDAAVESGADFIKFQTFRAEQSLSVDTPLANYQVENAGGAASMLEMVKKLEFLLNNNATVIINTKNV